MKKLSIKKEDSILLDIQCHASNVAEFARIAVADFDRRDSLITCMHESFDALESKILEL